MCQIPRYAADYQPFVPPIHGSGECSRREESAPNPIAPNPIALGAASDAVVAKPALILRAFLTTVQICRPELRLAFGADRGGAPRALWIPVAHFRPKSPNVQAPAPRVFHLNLHPLAPRIVHLDGNAPEHYALKQALAPGVFHLNYDAPEHALAPRVFRLYRRDPAPRFFHLNHHAIRQALAPDSFASGLKSVWRDLRDAGCPILADQADFVRWKQ